MLLSGWIVSGVGSLMFLVTGPRLLLPVRFVQGPGVAALSTLSLATATLAERLVRKRLERPSSPGS